MRSGQPRVLFFAAATVLLLFNYPWLSLFSSAQLLFGIPPLLLYLFGLWLGFILIIRALLKPSASSDLGPLPVKPPTTKASKTTEVNKMPQGDTPDV